MILKQCALHSLPRTKHPPSSPPFLSFLRRRDQGRQTLAETERAAGDVSPRLGEVGAVDFGHGSARNGRARAAKAGVLTERGTQNESKKWHVLIYNSKITLHFRPHTKSEPSLLPW